MKRTPSEPTCGLPGLVWPRPDARLPQFRLYYELAGPFFTDGFLHQQALPSDAAVLLGLAAVLKLE